MTKTEKELTDRINKMENQRAEFRNEIVNWMQAVDENFALVLKKFKEIEK